MAEKKTIPHISWSRMPVEALKGHYETTTQEYSQEEKEIIITLVNLVGEGKLRAFKDPTGKIRYQQDTLDIMEAKLK